VSPHPNPLVQAPVSTLPTARPRRRARLGTLAAWCVPLLITSVGQAGFIPTTGSHDYNTPGNWDAGDIDGVFDESLTGSLTATFAADTVLDHGWDFSYSNNTVTIAGDGAGTADVVTLGGDVSHSSAQTTAIGGAANGSDMELILPGAMTTTFDISAGTINIFSPLSETGGAASLTKNGDGTLNFTGTSGGNTAIYTGTTTVNGGTLRLNKLAANGGPTGDYVVGDDVVGGTDTLVLGQANQIGNGSNIQINSSGRFDVDTTGTDNIGGFTLAGGGELRFLQDGRLNLGSGTTISVTAPAAGFSGPAVISGTGTIEEFLLNQSLTFNIATDAELEVGSGIQINIGDIFIKDGAGTMTLDGRADFALAGSNLPNTSFVVDNGELVLNGDAVADQATGVDAARVGGGGNEATLSGSGTLTLDAATDELSVNNLGAISPGDGIGTLTIIAGNVEFNVGSELIIELAGASSDLLAIDGDLDLDSTLDNLTVTGTATESSYTLATYSGTLTGTFDSEVIPVGYFIDYGSGSNSAITIQIIPEPAAMALILAGMPLTLGRNRR